MNHEFGREPHVFKYFAAAVAVVAATGVASAQQPESDPDRARYNLFTMEGVLERAVEQGANQLSRQVRRLMPDMLLMSGAAEARGFRLEGYGVFFDVEVPVLRRSVAWSLRTMVDGNGVAAASALQRFKSHIDTIDDPRVKADLQQALRRIELQVGPAQPPAVAGPRRGGAPARGTVTAAVDVEAAPAAPAQPQAPPLTPADEALLTNPSDVYEKEVVDALADAMLDYSAPMGVGPEEWLTVAARDNEHRDRLMPGDSYDLMTIVLRVKGSDLAAFRADRITREEARKRIEVREF
jgi:hypothetical protein